jgi:tetraacyldisaccharide 4'-kinase
MKTPSFWYKPFGFCAAVLWPLSLLYLSGVRAYALLKQAQPVDIPVICLGNLVVGGTGKTPAVIALVKLLQQEGYQVHILTRGYRGRLKGPVQVNLSEHRALDVGDEALLLAQVAPTWVSKNRFLGAQAAQTRGAEVIVMDDGLQNQDLKKDLIVLTVDPALGFGNGLMLPAGPLREPLKNGLQKTHFILMPVEQEDRPLPFTPKTNQAVIRISHSLLAADISALKGRTVFAFSGIAHPNKFYNALRKEQLTIANTQDFPDHHFFSEKELRHLSQEASSHNAILVTTEKDWVRLDEAWRSKIRPIHLISELHHISPLFSALKDLMKRKEKNELSP